MKYQNFSEYCWLILRLKLTATYKLALDRAIYSYNMNTIQVEFSEFSQKLHNHKIINCILIWEGNACSRWTVNLPDTSSSSSSTSSSSSSAPDCGTSVCFSWPGSSFNFSMSSAHCRTTEERHDKSKDSLLETKNQTMSKCWVFRKICHHLTHPNVFPNPYRFLDYL